jgi:GTP-binding protein YchF
MQIAIVGLPHSGKTTLFQTITNTYIDSNAFQKKDENKAIVKVPDKRVDKLSEIFNPKKTTYASIEIVDMAGQQKIEGKSPFSENFLAKVKNNDALLHVVRGFEDDTFPHPDGSIDLLRDINTLETEFILSDMTLFETRIERLNKQLQKLNSDEAKKELAILNRWLEALQDNRALRNLEFNNDEKKFLKIFQPLTAKPLLIALNLDETKVKESEKITEDIKNKVTGKNLRISAFFAKIEMELGQLPAEEAETFMNDYGIKESALDRLIADSYRLLGLQSFFTVGDDECRAWTIKKGDTAQEAAAVIHSDFYNTFIRAETVGYDDFVSNGSFAKCKEKGIFRLEGKEYIVKDGDILSIRHS